MTPSPGLVGAAALRHAAGPPLVPDAPTARQWAVDELSRPDYHAHESVLSRALNWLEDHLSGADVHGIEPRAAAVVAVAVVVVALAVGLVVAGPVRRTRRARTSHVVLDDDLRSADAMRAAADAAAGAGDWPRAVVERYRATVRSLEERAVLDERPGRTADEAAREAAPAFPAHAGALAASARVFDEVLYGEAAVDQQAHELVRSTDEAVRAARPVRTVDLAPEPA